MLRLFAQICLSILMVAALIQSLFLYLYGRTLVDYISIMRYTGEAQYVALLAIIVLLVIIAIGKKSES